MTCTANWRRRNWRRTRGERRRAGARSRGRAGRGRGAVGPVRADARLDEDLPGRLALARELLRQDSAAHHESGLRIAAALMSRWRSAVPELLSDVAEFVDDPDESNRSFALRVLAMCGTAARPWSDRAAAHLSEDDEPYEPARRHAVWMLSRAGDERCVEPLIDGLSSGRATGFSASPPYLSTCDWEKSDLNYTEALRPFAVRAEALPVPLPKQGGVPAAADRDRRSSIRRTPRKGPESGGGRPATRTKSCTPCWS
ncbi:hypothetical protein SCALM49S_06978 [Streptomyces californicus]